MSENQKRLIDADALINWMETKLAPEEWSVNQFDADWIYRFIDDATTVDAVEVVRCKECRFFGKYSNTDEFPSWCKRSDCYAWNDHFCSLGVRKE